ncbi:DUF58 domain-containing protein [Dinoroseobacter sp. S124A]|uniref:DUF58 domain-containing protein n=1 Tax=Dinoroseobacter sp. S124A TaxID=3415128 RepID=UPI003C7C5CDB
MSEALSAPGIALRADPLIALRRRVLSAETPAVLAALPGGFATRRKGHGLEVADMREYVAGDDIRHLDRGTTARTGRLHIREFQEERDRVTLLVVDFRPAMLWGVRRAFRSVAAAEALVLIGWNVIEIGGRVGMMALGQGAPVVVPPAGRVRGMLNVIGGLVRAHEAALADMAAGQGGDPSLDAALSRADRLVPSGSEIVIASGFDVPGPGLADRLNALARRRVPRLVMIRDGQDLPRGVYPIVTRDGQRLRVALGGGAEAQDSTAAPVQTVAGHSALVLDAGAEIEATARRIAAAFPAERAA